MRTNLTSRLILSTGIFFLSFNLANSQVLQVTSDITPEEMVEILIGSGLDYSNVVFTGADTSRGSFWGGPGNIGVSNGIILTSGNVLNIVSLDGQSFDVQLIGQDGQTNKSVSWESQISPDISSLPAGVYFLRIIYKGGVSTRKIFKN